MRLKTHKVRAARRQQSLEPCLFLLARLELPGDDVTDTVRLRVRGSPSGTSEYTGEPPAHMAAQARLKTVTRHCLSPPFLEDAELALLPSYAAHICCC